MSLDIDCRLLRGKFSLDIQLSVERGSTLAITGENGSGKTTTLDTVAGLLACTDGKILLHGKVLDDSTSGEFVQPELRRVSTVFQGGGLLPHLSVEKNILFGRNTAYKNTAKFEDLIEQFNLGGLMSRKPPTLSGGQRQRVALARAFLAPSDVLLLDEPTTSLDASSRDEVRRAMRVLSANYGGVVILVSHDDTEVAELATQVAKITVSRGDFTSAKLGGLVVK